MNKDLQVMMMGGGGPAAYFPYNWTMQGAASWMMRYTGAPMCKPDGGNHPGIEYKTFARGFYDRLGTLLLYSREIWLPATINGKKVPETRWRHLSMSFHESDLKAGPGLYGRMRQVLKRDVETSEKWVECFFGGHRKYLLCEPPETEHGKKFDIWHYRLLCGENWLPPNDRTEVPDEAFNDAGWLTHNQARNRRLFEQQWAEPGGPVQ